MALEVLDQGMVVGRFLTRVTDGSDAGREPDTRALSGTVRFIPSTRRVLVTAPDPVTVYLDTITATVDGDGYLGVRNGAVFERGVMLDIDSAATTPRQFAWTVEFDLYCGRTKVDYPGFVIDPPTYTGPGTEWDLTLRTPHGDAPAGPGIGFRPPAGIPLYLSNGQDFIHDEEHPNTSWPTGTSARITFAAGPVWSATVTGRIIRWRIESAGTTEALVPDRTAYTAWLTMPNELDPPLTDDWRWFSGQVVRTD